METVANQIRAQLEEHEGVASMDLSPFGDLSIEAIDPEREETQAGLEVIPDCRVIISVRSFADSRSFFQLIISF